MLPTFLFVLGACVIYALVTAWRQRALRLLRSAKREPCSRLLSCTGALLIPFGIALLLARAVPDSGPRHSNLARVLLGEERAGLAGQVFTYPVGLPTVVHAPEEPPTYALLHPQMTTHPIWPEKKTSVPFLRKPQRKVRLKISDKKVKLSYSSGK